MTTGSTYIYLDISAAVNGKAGIGRYALSLAGEMAEHYPEQLRFFFNSASAKELPGAISQVPFRRVSWGYKPWRMAVLLGQAAGIGFNRLLDSPRLYHATEHLLMPLHGIPTVLTVHDIIYYLFPAYHKKLNYWYLNLAMPLFCRRATAIIAVSEATKQDLCVHYKIPPAKIHVIHEAPSRNLSPATEEKILAVRRKYKIPQRYVLHVGTIEPRKNLSRLLSAFEKATAREKDLSLVLVGGKGWLSADFYTHLAQSPAREAVIMPGFIADDDLSALYSGAELTVMPSLYEGFGLPLLEAMSCGCPVAASNRSCLPEIGGSAAMYFDPENISEISETLVQLLQDKALRQELKSKSLNRAQEFSWHKAAVETYTLYRKILEG
jgi:glycosyltransferase involved in cell wall biosynthesis